MLKDSLHTSVIIIVTFSMLGCHRDDETPLETISINGITSYYVYSGIENDKKEGLPVIIFIGHPADSPKRLLEFANQFDQPVLLIWSGLLKSLPDDTLIDDQKVWQQKRKEFARQFESHSEHFSFNKKQVYLTGFSALAVYAWMLAYDRPELYTGVVAMSAVSYPEQIQHTIENTASVITVVVRGEHDHMFPKHLEQEKQTGHTIESLNPHSRFILKKNKGHKDVAQYWLEQLQYIIQFIKPESISKDV